MATSPAKTVGLILLVALILIIVLRMTPFILSPLGIFPGIWHAVRTPDIRTIHIGPLGYVHFNPLQVATVALLILWIFVIIWVYRDAERRGMNGVLWALLVFIGNLIGLLIYLIVRSDITAAPREIPAARPCPSCQKPVAESFTFCPHCGTKLQAVCPECGKPVEHTWRNCPHCGHELKD